MKNTLLLFLLFCCSAAFAQQIDSCDNINSDYAIRRIYQRDFDRTIEALEVFTLHFDAEISKIDIFKKWAKSKGYITTIDSTYDKSKTNFKMITITDITPRPSLAYFTSVFESVVDKKNELGITDCVAYGGRNSDLPSKGLCNGMYMDTVFNEYYNRSLKNNITVADTMKFRFMVNPAEAVKLKEWIKANDFTLYPDGEIYTGNSDENYVHVYFTKQLQEPLYIFFKGTLKQVERMRDELGLKNCGSYYVSYTPH